MAIRARKGQHRLENGHNSDSCEGILQNYTQCMSAKCIEKHKGNIIVLIFWITTCSLSPNALALSRVLKKD